MTVQARRHGDPPRRRPQIAWRTLRWRLSNRASARPRDAGKVVYGLCECKCPEPFIAACDKFIFFEVLVLKRPAETAAPVPATACPDLSAGPNVVRRR